MIKMTEKHKQFVARETRKHGFEVMPDEVPGILNDAINTIRVQMIKAGHPEFVAMTNAEIRDLIGEAYCS